MSDGLNEILISSSEPDFDKKLTALRCRIAQSACFDINTQEGKKVVDIIDQVRRNGDKAVAHYTEKFDGVKLTSQEFKISIDELKKAYSEIDPELLKSIKKSINNVRKYQSEIFVGGFKHPGLKYTPIERVSVCIPGASAPLPSTVIMTAVPAQAAGVKHITVISPPRHNGSIHPVILAVCYELGIENVYRIGGVQAVAALAFGTRTIAKVDKIVGPGNQWVQTAKKMVFGQVAIDSIAGPSEVLIMANKKANPAWIAADMLSQAEHAPGSAFVFTDSQKIANQTLDELKEQLNNLSRAEQTKKCLTEYSRIAVFEKFDEVIKYANILASEHLEIQCGQESRAISEQITNAGAIFIGSFTPVAVGDYFAGPSHTLPTGMTARFFSALSSNDFVKSTSIIEYDKEKLSQSSSDIIRLAKVEGLDAHAKSVQIRQQ